MRVKDITKGMKLQETERGVSFVYEALEDARSVATPPRVGHECQVKILVAPMGVDVERGAGNTLTLFECEDPGMFALKLEEVHDAVSD